MSKKQKHFICQFSVRIGDTELYWHHLAEGTDEDEVFEEHEVEHDECGLDTEDSPIGGACGQYCTELVNVKRITPTQKKFLNSIGIY